MKKLWILIGAMAPLLGLEAQTLESPWMGSHYSVSVGGATDYHTDMSMNWMREHTVNERDLQTTVTDEEFANYYIVSGGIFTLEKSYLYGPTQLSEQSFKRELRIGVRLMVDREAMINHYKVDEQEGYIDSESLTFCLLDNELGLDVAHLWKHQGKSFSIYGGIGVNTSATFNPKMLRITRSFRYVTDTAGQVSEPDLSEPETTVYDAKKSVFARVQAPVGVAWNPIKRVGIGLEYRAGFGVEQIIGGHNNVLPYSALVSFRLSYFLKQSFLG
jgi:hypothetical protein